MSEENETNTEDTIEKRRLMNEKISSIGAGLMRLAEEQIGVRQVVEDRWLTSLEQYLGKYDARTQSALAKSGGSQAFVNVTRSKTAAAESRLSDMLFPTDDKNWGIEPTPVPDLLPEQLDMEDNEDAQGQLKGIKESIMHEAREKAKKMEQQINDQLTESNYQDKCRSVIHDMCLYGTGVIKAPVIQRTLKKKWRKLESHVYELDIEAEIKPGVEHVKVWDFFPDMSANKLSDARFIFERKYISRHQLKELMGVPGYINDQIKAVLDSDDTRSYSASGSSYIAKLRELSGLSVDLNKGRYELWEYHGPLNVDDAMLCGCDVDKDEGDVDVIVSFIGSNVIRAVMNPMETNDRPYSIVVYEQDDSSIFGYGIPYMIQNEQRIINAAWRMVLDNAGLSTGPQVIMNKEVVTPADGDWALKARKIWWLNDPALDVRQAFATFSIPSHQNELTSIFQIAKEMVDEVTNLPMLAQGEIGNAPDTAQGMSMLLNNSNVVIRRIVKGFDDDLTTPLITRFYNWNMQNSEDEEIKGDFNITARGSSTLLVKETQNQALMRLLTLALQDPDLRQITKIDSLFRKVAQTQHIFPDDIIMSEEEVEQKRKEAEQMQSQSQPQIDPEKMLAEQTKLQIAQLKAQTDIEVAKIRSHDNEVKVATDAQKKQLEEDNKANLFLAERQLKEQFGSGI